MNEADDDLTIEVDEAWKARFEEVCAERDELLALADEQNSMNERLTEECQRYLQERNAAKDREEWAYKDAQISNDERWKAHELAESLKEQLEEKHGTMDAWRHISLLSQKRVKELEEIVEAAEKVTKLVQLTKSDGSVTFPEFSAEETLDKLYAAVVKLKEDTNE